MPRAFCHVCSNDERGDVEFPTVRELNEHIKNGHPLPPKAEEAPPQSTPQVQQVAPVTQEVPKPKKKEVILVYKYIGSCESCSTELDTIGVKVGSNHVMVAYCPNCKIQYNETVVIPIDQQFKNDERLKTKTK